MVYTSGALSLAALEILVHLNPPVPFSYAAIPVEFDEALVKDVSLDALPEGWRVEPPPLPTRQFGDAWVRGGTSAILAFPSVIVPLEKNYLLNPAHPDFKKTTIGQAVPFSFDPRLLG